MSDQSYFPSFQVHLRSIDGSSTASVFATNEEVIQVPKAYSVYASVVSASIPFSFYNVPSDTPDANGHSSSSVGFAYTIAGVDYVWYIALPPGQYSATDLAQCLTFNGVLPGQTCIAPVTVGCVYLPHVNAFKFFVSSLNLLTSQLTSFSIAPGAWRGSLAMKMGFALSTPFVPDGQYPNAYSVQSDQGADLSGCRAVYIRSSFRTRNLLSDITTGTDILAKVPIDAPFGSIVHYTNPNGFRNLLYDKYLGNMSVYLTDEYANLLTFNNVDWDVTLQFDVLNPDFVPLFNDAVDGTLNIEGQ